MNFDILYLILPFLFYSLQFVILTKFSRNEGSMQIAFYRQLWIVLIWLPLFFFFSIDFNLVWKNIWYILLTSGIWAFYLFVNFKSLDYVPVAIQSVIQTTSRILLTIITWVLLLSDKINFNQWIAIILLIFWIFLLFKKEKFDKKWIFLSVLWWLLLVANWYYFIMYSKQFDPIIAGYILEFFNWLFLFLILFFQWFSKNNSLEKSFKIKAKSFWVILATSALPLIWSIAISKSYEIYSFTIVGIFLTMAIPASMIFWYLILKEKISKKAMLSIIIITISIVLIKYFWN
jgi:drug/metabolite transporter (DMT)-like permease